MEDKVNVALVASIGLGDAIIFMMLAENLRRNGFNVTLYSNPGSQLLSWLPAVTVKPYPALEKCDDEFKGYDLVIADGVSVLGKQYQPEERFSELASRYLYLSLGKIPNSLVFDHTARLQRILSAEKFQRCRRIAGSAGTVRFQGGDRTMTMVKCTLSLCRDIWGLENVACDTGLRPPENSGLQHRRYSRRILLHPFSSDDKKNWPLEKFLKLAVLLRNTGWDPAFTVSPKEMSTLRQVVPEDFPAPLFNSISDLAGYVYESRAMVANDSGPGHLASALGIPTLTISRKGNDHRWRPDFAPGNVVCPVIRFKLGSQIHWKPFLGIKRVNLALLKLLEHTASCPNV